MNTIPKQTKQYRADYYDEHGDPCTLIATVRHDDECRNGHNTFAITADLYEKHVQRGEPTTKHIGSGKTLWVNAGGCLHEEIARRIPELAPFIKWHLCSTDGPMHYLANTIYLAGDRDAWGKPGKARELDAARRAAIWPEATDEELSAPREILKAKLEARLPVLLAEFRAAVESLGLKF